MKQIANILRRCFAAVSGAASAMEKNADGDQVWRNGGGQAHRTDGPAIIWADGSRAWRLNGLRHRSDGPAYESAGGLKSWWVNDKRHRLDGPAVEGPDGYREWWVEDKKLTQRQFNKHPAVKALRFGGQVAAGAADDFASTGGRLRRLQRIVPYLLRKTAVRDFRTKIRGPG